MTTMTADQLSCRECGMSCEPDEYHPYAACLMFKACHDSTKVRANLQAVVYHRNTRPTAVASHAEGEVVAWLKRWKDPETGEGRIRVDLKRDSEPWLNAIGPTMEPLYAHPPRSVDDAKDAARLDFVAQQSYSMRKRGDGRSNAFLWDENFPIEGAGVEANMRDCIDAAMAARGDAK